MFDDESQDPLLAIESDAHQRMQAKSEQAVQDRLRHRRVSLQLRRALLSLFAVALPLLFVAGYLESI